MHGYDPQKIVRGIINATLDVFSTMIGLEATPEPHYEEAASSGAVDGVVALIGLAGNWTGGGMVHCDAGLARTLYARLLMTDCPGGDGVNEEVLDAVAEIANMIVGNVKNEVERDLGPLGMGIPSVVFGRNFTTRHAGSTWIVVPFACEGEHLLVKICLIKPAHSAGVTADAAGRVKRLAAV